MKKVLQACQRCGAPIVWDEVSSSITCEFCGAKTYIRSRFIIVEKVKDKLYKISSNIKTKAKRITKTCLENQTILSNNQLDKIYIGLKQTISNRYFKILFISVPILFISRSIIDDPVRPYKSDIKKQCQRIDPVYDAESKKFIVNKCTSDIYKVIRSINKIVNKRPGKKSKKSFYPLNNQSNFNYLGDENKKNIYSFYKGDNRIYIKNDDSSGITLYISFSPYRGYSGGSSAVEIEYIVPQYFKLQEKKNLERFCKKVRRDIRRYDFGQITWKEKYQLIGDLIESKSDGGYDGGYERIQRRCRE